MTSKDILFERVNHHVGEIIKVPKLVRGDSMQMVDAEIVGLYPKFVMVQDKAEPKYRWCVLWTDLM